MELFFRRYEGVEGSSLLPPLVILHGLLGSASNWHGIAGKLSERQTVYALDLRNHGRSPHLAEQTYQAMCDDLKQWCEKERISRMILMGHSMGGKVAMKFACQFPNWIHKLIIVDVKPLPILRDLPVLSAMDKLDLKSIKNHDEARKKLMDFGLTLELSRFAVTNLVKKGNEYSWRVNLPVFQKYESHIMRTGLSREERFHGPTYFLLGEKSNVVSQSEIPEIKFHFPHSEFSWIPGSGHNPHIEAPDEFVEKVLWVLK